LERPVRELVYLVATSIDGFIAKSDGDYTPLLVEGDSLAVLVAEYPETLPAQARDALGIDAPNRRFDTVLMGAHTYQVPGGLPSPYPHLSQVVFSRSLRQAPADVTVVAGQIMEHVQALKSREGLSIWLCGGGRLAAGLLPQIDRLLLKISPVLLGRGLPLFDGDVPATPFIPVSSRTFQNGVTVQEYVRSRVG
jgi:dihydrofolate reductase